MQIDVARAGGDDLDRDQDISGGRPLERAVAPDDDQVRALHDRWRIRAQRRPRNPGRTPGARGELGLDLTEETAPTLLMRTDRSRRHHENAFLQLESGRAVFGQSVVLLEGHQRAGCRGMAMRAVCRTAPDGSRQNHPSQPGPAPATTRDGDGRPSCPAIHALVATSASRSTPCAMPSPSSIQTRSSVARLPVADSAYGQPPSPPALRVDGGDAAAQRGERVGQRLAVRVVEVHGQLARRRRRPRCRRRARHRRGPAVPVPIVSPSEICSQPHLDSRAATDATCAGATAPSHGSPKHIET